ncbi:MAG: hypothetical protein CMQ28_05525 [Gammaproteobacteria bacterium]|nr:hypothetical protein [Gammaproteobacteria bacterium]
MKIPDSKPVEEKHPHKLFFGWWIVAGTIVIQGLHSTLLFLSFGAYLDQLQAAFGWSRTALSAAFSLGRIESGLLGPIQGWAIDKYGPRINIQIGTILFGGGFILLSLIQTLWQFYLVFFIVAIGASLAGFLTLQTAIANWFITKRARAMGIAQTGMGIAGGAAVGVAWILETFGWRITFFLAGIVILATGLPLARLFHHRPEDVGLLPDGRLPSLDLRDESADKSSRKIPEDADFTLSEAMRDRSFWLISIGHGAALLVVAGLQVHLIPHLTDLGWGLTQAASIIPIITFSSLLGQVGGGFLGDRYNKRFIAAAAMFGHACAMYMFATNATLIVIIAAAAIHGISWGARGPLMSAIRADYYGRRNFAKIGGMSSLIIQFGTVLGPMIGALLYSEVDGYRFAFLLLASLTGASAIFFLLARQPQKP